MFGILSRSFVLRLRSGLGRPLNASILTACRAGHIFLATNSSFRAGPESPPRERGEEHEAAFIHWRNGGGVAGRPQSDSGAPGRLRHSAGAIPGGDVAPDL